MKLIKKEIAFFGKIFKVAKEVWADECAEFERDVIEHPGAVAVLPFKDEKVFLVKQFRHAVREHLIEIPAGLIEEGESPEETAIRETEEEIGLKVKNLQKLAEVYSSPGILSERLYIYAASVDPDFRAEAEPDKDEKIEVLTFDFDELLKMVREGIIKDSKTVLAVLLFKDLQAKDNG